MKVKLGQTFYRIAQSPGSNKPRIGTIKVIGVWEDGLIKFVDDTGYCWVEFDSPYASSPAAAILDFVSEFRAEIEKLEKMRESYLAAISATMALFDSARKCVCENPVEREIGIDCFCDNCLGAVSKKVYHINQTGHNCVLCGSRIIGCLMGDMCSNDDCPHVDGTAALTAGQAEKYKKHIIQ